MQILKFIKTGIKCARNAWSAAREYEKMIQRSNEIESRIKIAEVHYERDDALDIMVRRETP